jgi:hypothetical protein
VVGGLFVKMLANPRCGRSTPAAFATNDESPSRVPLTDWYDTVTGKQQGFQARSLVGGLFVKMLADPAMWKKYASRVRN